MRVKKIRGWIDLNWDSTLPLLGAFGERIDSYSFPDIYRSKKACIDARPEVFGESKPCEIEVVIKLKNVAKP